MKTENEIKLLSLVERQKMVVELRTVQASDKFYANAKALIEFVTKKVKGWVEPALIEVKNVAGHTITVDGRAVEDEAVTKVYLWQYHALARYLEPSIEAAAALKRLADEAIEAEKSAPAAKTEPSGNIGEIIKTSIAEGFAALKKAGAAMVLLLGCLLFAGSAQGQIQQTAVGSVGNYHGYYIAGLNGGTNNVQGTNNYTTPSFTTNTIVSPSVYNSNGIVYVTYTTNVTSIVTNIPGQISVVNADLADIYWGFQPFGSGSASGVETWNYSPDGVFWQSNALSMTLISTGTFVSTNVQLAQFAPGYLQLNTMGFTNVADGASNVVQEVTGKASKTGPF